MRLCFVCVCILLLNELYWYIRGLPGKNQITRRVSQTTHIITPRKWFDSARFRAKTYVYTTRDRSESERLVAQMQARLGYTIRGIRFVDIFFTPNCALLFRVCWQFWLAGCCALYLSVAFTSNFFHFKDATGEMVAAPLWPFWGDFSWRHPWRHDCISHNIRDIALRNCA